MTLNKGWREGAIGIPNGSKKVVHYYVKAGKRKSKSGIDGGKITGLIINTKDSTLAYYAKESGWVIPPQSEEAEIAIEILKLEYK